MKLKMFLEKFGIKNKEDFDFWQSQFFYFENNTKKQAPFLTNLQIETSTITEDFIEKMLLEFPTAIKITAEKICTHKKNTVNC